MPTHARTRARTHANTHTHTRCSAQWLVSVGTFICLRPSLAQMTTRQIPFIRGSIVRCSCSVDDSGGNSIYSIWSPLMVHLHHWRDSDKRLSPSKQIYPSFLYWIIILMIFQREANVAHKSNALQNKRRVRTITGHRAQESDWMKTRMLWVECYWLKTPKLDGQTMAC